MHTKSAVICKPHEVGTSNQEYWRKKWGGGTKHSGPSGYKTTPMRILARSMADKASEYRTRKVQK